MGSSCPDEEMMTLQQPNMKALQEAIHYFFEERIKKNNDEIKHIIVSDVNNWFIFDAREFETKFFKSAAKLEKYKRWQNKQELYITTDKLYAEIIKKWLDDPELTLTWTYEIHYEFSQPKPESEEKL